MLEDNIVDKIPEINRRAPSTPKEVGTSKAKLLNKVLKGAREKGHLPIIAEDANLEDSMVILESPMSVAIVAQSKPISSQHKYRNHREILEAVRNRRGENRHSQDYS